MTSTTTLTALEERVLRALANQQWTSLEQLALHLEEDRGRLRSALRQLETHDLAIRWRGNAAMWALSPIGEREIGYLDEIERLREAQGEHRVSTLPVHRRQDRA